jgi:hypothetical protein
VKQIFSILFALTLVVSLGLATAAPVLADTIRHVPSVYPTIQAALNASEDGDTIMVAAGEYDAFLVDGKANINIISTEGATVTTAASYSLLGELGFGYDLWGMAVVADSENINIQGINFDGTAISEEGVVGILYVDSTGRITDLTVENLIGTLGMGTGVIIIDDEGTSTVEIKGSTISNNDIGIAFATHSTQEAHFNNIVGNSNGGMVNYGEETVDAIYNWWGHASGPYHPIANPSGIGNPVGNDVDFEPWLRAEVVTQTITGSGPVDAIEEADTEVLVTGTGSVTVTVAKLDSNPGGDPPAGTVSLGRYIDVSISDPTGVEEIEIRHYYTDDDVADISGTLQEYLRLRWWDGDEWRPYSIGGVNTDSTGDYAGYIWGRVTAYTEPNLNDLTGTHNGDFWEGPSNIGCGCFIATAAYGTDTAWQLDILREFRDAVLLPNGLGAKFVSFYHKTSPPVADFISQDAVLRTVVRVGFVDPIVKILTWTHDLWST